MRSKQSAVVRGGLRPEDRNPLDQRLHSRTLTLRCLRREWSAPLTKDLLMRARAFVPRIPVNARKVKKQEPVRPWFEATFRCCRNGGRR